MNFPSRSHLRIHSSINTNSSCRRQNVSTSVIVILVVLVLFWCVCLTLILTSTSSPYHSSPSRTINTTTSRTFKTTSNNDVSTREHVLPSSNLSRGNPHVKVKADVVGNLGPIEVVLQANPGTNWLHDRWQAASDMHGTNIPGEHWIELDFGGVTGRGGGTADDVDDRSSTGTVIATSIVLDWETAYAEKYIIEASMRPISGRKQRINDSSSNDIIEKKRGDDEIWVLYDGSDPQQQQTMRTVSEHGQSPGVKEKRPLHVVHTLSLHGNANHQRPFRYLRLHILKSATGWGVSLWQFDVFGFHASETDKR